MEDDLISSLNRQIKEDALENYLTERRLVEMQIEDFLERGELVRIHAAETGKRITRMAFLAIRAEMHEELVTILGIPGSSFWNDCFSKEFCRKVRFIRVTAFTTRVRFRKVFFTAYSRLYQWMAQYRKAYEDLEIECRAVNMNIKSFQNNFDLLALLQFLRSLDCSALERKHFLGENFTAEEICSVDKKLYIQPVSVESLKVPSPLALPYPAVIETVLSDLASRIYDKYQSQARKLIR